MQVEIGKVYDGKVTGITNFGAFVEIGDNTVGLVHISEVAHTYVKDIRDHIKEGDEVKVKVISVNPAGKISMSISKATPAPERPAPRGNGQKPRQSSRPMQPVDFSKPVDQSELTFEDKMRIFMQHSEERMGDIRRNMDSKRGGGSYRK